MRATRECAVASQCRNLRDVQYVLAKGIENRRRRHHSLNSESSRSHAMFSVYLDAAPREGGAKEDGAKEDGAKEGGATRYGRFSILDLAGSENVRPNPQLHPRRTRKETDPNTRPHPEQVRATQSQGAGLKEAGAINRSLFALGQAHPPRPTTNTPTPAHHHHTHFKFLVHSAQLPRCTASHLALSHRTAAVPSSLPSPPPLHPTLAR